MSPGTESGVKSNCRNGNCEEIVTRPNASPGFWLCTLIPLSYLVNNYRHPKSAMTFEYKMTSIIALGLCIQSAHIFLSIRQILSKHFRFLLRGTTILCTCMLIWQCLKQTLLVSLCWASSANLLYSLVYSNLFVALPKSFTYGEASLVAQGFVLFILNAALQIPHFVREPPMTDMSEMNAIMMTALLCLAVSLGLIYVFEFLRNAVLFYSLMAALGAAVCVMPVTLNFPVVTLWTFIVTDIRRVFIIIFYFGLVGLTIGTIKWRLQTSAKASTSIRKIFHLLVVFVYIPGLLYQCTLLYIATGVALAVILVFETIRLTNMPPFGDVLHKSFDLFSDEKDAGIVALTPFYLLIGCSLPLWINPCTCLLADSAGQNLVPMMAGVLSIGVGDTAASVVGSSLGKYKWPTTSKSIEGTIANIFFQSLIVAALVYFKYLTLTQFGIAVVGTAITVSSIVEAFTDQVDNLVLPLVFYNFCAML